MTSVKSSQSQTLPTMSRNIALQPSDFSHSKQRSPLFPTFLLAVSLNLLHGSDGATFRVVTLVFSEGVVAPDNFQQKGILINGRFPGPEIVVDKEDTLVVHAVNLLSHGFALHMHGLFQRETPESDGVPGVTQDIIPPNSTFTHRVQIGRQSGTYAYHAHTGLDLVWAFGPLIIRDDESAWKGGLKQYYGEKTLVLTQCWHELVEDILNGLEGSPFSDVPDTASLLINGKSWGNWEKEEGNSSSSMNASDSTGYEVFTVKQNETYRFRVIGLGMDSMLEFSIENHTKLEIIEVDGILVEPSVSDHLQINSAQRYSVLVKMDQPVGNYWIRSKMLPGPGPDNGRAILHYEGAPNPSSVRHQIFPGTTEELELNNWILDSLTPRQNLLCGKEQLHPVPTKIDKELIVSSTQRVLSDNTTRFDINGKLHRHKGPSLFHQLLAGGKATMLADEENGIFPVSLGEKVQLVFQNTMSDEGDCEQHPWHTHGYNFHVVGSGPDSYDPVLDGAIIGAVVNSNSNSSSFRFPVRDVVTLFPAQRVENATEGAPCGWTAVRFVADNPGLWLVHCHLTPHQIMGKWFVLFVE